MARRMSGLLERFASLRRDERGYAIMATLAIFLFLFTLVAAVYAVGETIHERIKMQNACDNAAYSAAVVQADGLSRMACVNRAMSWTYVQMSNRQMDYITYRWLKLTSRRFGEDKKNADDYATRLVLAADRQLGWWALLEAAVSGAINGFLDVDCASGGHGSKSNGLACWAGLSSGAGKGDRQYSVNHNDLKLNAISLSGVINKTNIDKLLSAFSVFDSGSGDGPQTWGQLLGKLIDYDKQNIDLMNRSLAAINAQMSLSMALTAESVLKTTLADNRLSGGSALSDYYLTIQIPTAGNPYDLSEEDSRSKSVSSYFSPLRNTEVDERLFLQMQTPEHADQPLASFFPCLLMDGSGTAFGLDQWFIRGKGVYEDRSPTVVSDDEAQMSVVADKSEDYWLKSTALPSWQDGRSGWLSGKDARLTGTCRSEGELGIQRVYKDANLNETEAGIRMLHRKVDRGNHVFDGSAIGKAALNAFKGFFFQKGDEEGGTVYSSDDGGDKESAGDAGIADVEKTLKEIDDTIKGREYFIAQLQGEIDASKDPEADAAKIAENRKLIEKTRSEILELQKERAALESQIAAYKRDYPNGGMASNDSGPSATTEDPEKDRPGSTGGETPGKLIGTIFSSVFDYLAGKYADIEPSCGNAKKSSFEDCPMCRNARDTTALYVDYRWASCKYYCLTKLKTWLYTLIFGYKPKHGEVYTGDEGNSRKIAFCDTTHEHEFYKIKLLFKTIRFEGDGNGHWGFPKWFCGSEPAYAGNSYFGKSLWGSIARYFPPVAKEDITGSCHGYMDDTWDLGKEGLLKPVRPLWNDKTYYTRDESCSCAPFIDGTFSYARGSDSAAGLIRGHARIYGDDKEIFDNRYVGAVCKPWVLNAKFFNGGGTVVVGAARRFYNPFASLFSLLQANGETQVSDRSVLSAFDIPSGNYMWTMSAARAAVRHRRRNGAFDGPRQYQVTYDPTCDAENLYYHADRPLVYDASTKTWRNDVAGWEQANNGGRRALTRSDDPNPPPIYDGCVCRTENATTFREMWNLCESDWDATLLPLRYAGVKATLNLKQTDDDDVQDFCEQDYRTRLALVKYAHECREDPDRDDSVGAGANWVWDTAIRQSSTSLATNPFVSSMWKRASENYFNPLETGWSPGPQLLQKANRLPDEKPSETELRFWNLLQRNRVL